MLRIRFAAALPLLLFGVSLMAAASTAPAQPTGLDGRNVLLLAGANDLAAAAPRSQAAGAALSYSFEVGPADLADDTQYAVAVTFAAPSAPPAVAVNGRVVRSAPVPNGRTWFYRAPALAIQTGTNTLSISPNADAGERGWTPPTEAAVFSLLDSFEEVHFGAAFSARQRETGGERSSPATDARQAEIDIIHYDLDVTLNMAAATLPAAAAEITAEAVVDGVDQIVLDFVADGSNLTISSVTFEPGGVAPGFAHSIIGSGSTTRLVVPLPAADPSIDTGEQVTVRVVYSGTPDASAGAFGLNVFNRTSNNGSGNPVIYTFNEPYSARYWFPCKDLPDDKATVDIHITCPTAYIPVSNGTLTGIDALGGGLHRYNWSEAHPLASYLISITCTNFDYDATTYTALDTVTTMELAHYTWPGEINGSEATILANSLDIMNFYAATFGEYPFLDEKYVTATWGGGFGMEHQTATSINEGNLLTGSEPGKSRRNVHEMAHQWFGDSLTNVDFTHLWLQEGWATYCEALYEEYDLGVAQYHSRIASWISSGINDSTPMVNANADAFATSLVYRKGALVLHMLRAVMGDTDFFQATQNYLANHAYGTVETQDFEDEMEAVYGAPLDWFFAEWVYGIGRPDYDWWWEPASGSSVKVFVYQGGTFFEMPIFIHLQLMGGGEEIFTVYNDQPLQSFTLTPSSGTVTDVTFDPDNWIYKTSTDLTGTAPSDPTIQSVVYSGSGATSNRVTISWTGSVGALNGYEIQATHDRSCWETVAASPTVDADATSYEYDYTTTTGCLPASIETTGLYFRVRATSNSASPSAWTDVYGFRPPPGSGGAPTILVVDGFDRSLTGNTQPHEWAAVNGLAIADYQASFDTCANELLGGTFLLGDYDVVVWVSAEESTANESFSSAEQTLVTAYLQGGGRLFVSGSEIAWDLDRISGPTTADRTFFNSYLKADWPGSNAYDDSNDWGVAGSAGGIFDGMTFAIDDGTGGIYAVGFPDYFDLNGGSTEALRYSTQNGICGLVFSGTFSGGSAPAKLVYFGFGFETITTAGNRNAVMAAILGYFGLAAEVPVDVSAFSLF